MICVIYLAHSKGIHVNIYIWIQASSKIKSVVCEQIYRSLKSRKCELRCTSWEH